MVSISPEVQSAYYIILKQNAGVSRLREISRRLSRSATLDGGGVLVDSGYSASDRVLTVNARVTSAEQAILEYIAKNYTRVTVVTAEGVFSCGVSNLVTDNGDVTLTLWPES
jgi:hypothetical protein